MVDNVNQSRMIFSTSFYSKHIANLDFRKILHFGLTTFPTWHRCSTRHWLPKRETDSRKRCPSQRETDSRNVANAQADVGHKPNFQMFSIRNLSSFDWQAVMTNNSFSFEPHSSTRMDFERETKAARPTGWQTVMAIHIFSTRIPLFQSFFYGWLVGTVSLMIRLIKAM